MKYEEDYFNGTTSQFANGFSDATLNKRRADTLSGYFNMWSSLELGCSDGGIIEILRSEGVDAIGMDISKCATRGKLLFVQCCDVTTAEFPKAELVYSFDFLEHLTEEEIDRVLEKCREFDSIFHSVSVSCEEYGDIIHLDGMDKTHISMHTPSWWLKKFHDKLGKSHYIGVLTRLDYLTLENKKFTNTNFILRKQPINLLSEL